MTIESYPLEARSADSKPQDKSSRTYLSMASFNQFALASGGHRYVKVVFDRESGLLHLIDGHKYSFHVDFIAEKIMGIHRDQLRTKIDEFNAIHYFKPDRQFYLGTVSVHSSSAGSFFAFETSDVDTMSGEMLIRFWNIINDHCDPSLPLYVKPANHGQEVGIKDIDVAVLPRIFHHELFRTTAFVPLNQGKATGRIRLFESLESYRKSRPTLKWYDIIVMERVPDDVPRLAGMLMNKHTTPLSHTNVLACSWQIPNAVQIGIIDHIKKNRLDGNFVEYIVDPDQCSASLTPLAEEPKQLTSERPSWMTARVTLESPDINLVTITPLSKLRQSDRHCYGTKAANLGELSHVVSGASKRLTGFYRVPRPPRPNLIGYLEDFLDTKLIPEQRKLEVEEKAQIFIKNSLKIPRGIAIPFSVQQSFLESSPKIQQCIGKLKMALELDAIEADSLTVQLQNLIRKTRFTDSIRDRIDAAITQELAGVSSFIVRSSSNAEDLKGFPAAGMYESINHLTSSDKIFESIKEVWASLVSPRCVRLRHDVGISLDDCYMGVIIQEEKNCEMGGVMVTTNPTKGAGDFRNVYINASETADSVVSGEDHTSQYLFNTVEGGGRLISKGNENAEETEAYYDHLQQLAFAGRLLASHFSTDYSFSDPVDIEWLISEDTLYILQLRPYGT